jgi:hypothetical protein
MPIRDNSETDPDTILGLYNQPEDEVLLAEIALATGQARRDAVGAALSVTSSSATGTGGSAAESAGVVRPPFSQRPNPNDFDL